MLPVCGKDRLLRRGLIQEEKGLFSGTLASFCHGVALFTFSSVKTLWTGANTELILIPRPFELLLCPFLSALLRRFMIGLIPVSLGNSLT